MLSGSRGALRIILKSRSVVLDAFSTESSRAAPNMTPSELEKVRIDLGAKCSECIFAQELDGATPLVGQQQFSCRRFPPAWILLPAQDQAGNLGMRAETAFPTVAGDTWCGEFQQRRHKHGDTN